MAAWRIPLWIIIAEILLFAGVPAAAATCIDGEFIANFINMSSDFVKGAGIKIAIGLYTALIICAGYYSTKRAYDSKLTAFKKSSAKFDCEKYRARFGNIYNILQNKVLPEIGESLNEESINKEGKESLFNAQTVIKDWCEDTIEYLFKICEDCGINKECKFFQGVQKQKIKLS